MRSEAKLQTSEGIIGALIAAMIEGVNYGFFHHSNLGVAVAILVAIVGLLLTIMRHSLRVSFEETYQRVEQLASIVDLNRRARLPALQSIVNEYIDIHEDEFRRIKDQIINDASKKLHDLASNKRSPTLPRNEYYAWLLPMVYNLRKGNSIKAVSTSSEVEWDNSPEEERFLEANLQAARAGCIVERIFIVKRSNLKAFLSNPAIDAQTMEAGNGVIGSVAFLEDLERKAAVLLQRLGSGVLLINERVALLDQFSEGGHVRGEVTMEPGELNRYLDMFTQFKIMAIPLTRSLATDSEV